MDQLLSSSLAIAAKDIQPNQLASLLPASLAQYLQGRQKRRLGDFFGLSNFGVNLTRLLPKAMSSFCHSHSRQDELIFILEGYPTLKTSKGSVELSPGMCAGFKAGSGLAHHLINQTHEDVWYLEIGDRMPDDEATYPDIDLKAEFTATGWVFKHKDGTSY